MDRSAVASTLLATTYQPANSTLISYAIPFQKSVISPTQPGAYNAATYRYTCLQTGPHLFSVTAAVPGTRSPVLSQQGRRKFPFWKWKIPPRFVKKIPEIPFSITPNYHTYYIRRSSAVR